MSGRPLVSVVMIFLNAARFIEEAIESVIAQTYDRWELLLVDDGSTDGSGEIARRYAAAHPGWIRYLTHPGHSNEGMSASRNLGIAHATGEYVALLDADDVWLPPKLEEQVAILGSRPEAVMVYGPTQWWYSWTGRPEDAQRDFIHELGVPADSLITPPTLLKRFLVDEGISPCTCSMLIRRDVLTQVGAFEPRFRGLYEDQALCAKLALESSVLALGSCSYRYRQHPDSAVSVAQRTGAAAAARAVFLDWLASYMTERGVTDAELWRILERERTRSSQRIAGRAKARAGALWRSARTRLLRTGAKGGSP